MDYLSDYNLRATEMWNHISKSVNFRGKTVIDLGCGYGDMLCYAAKAGAKSVIGIEKNLHIAEHARVKANVAREYRNVTVMNADAVDYVESMSEKYDIGMCFSVIPYIDMRQLKNFIAKIIEQCDKSLFEIQYYGDGPGLSIHKCDEDVNEMFSELHEYMNSKYNIDIIGKTFVPGRNRWRKIWLVENRSDNE